MRLKILLAIVVLALLAEAVVVTLSGPKSLQRAVSEPQRSETGNAKKTGAAGETYTTEETDYHVPPQTPDPALADDTLEQKQPAFDAAVVDSRPVGDWQVNASAAVIKLDCPIIKPDVDGDLLMLGPSYAEAIGRAARHGDTLLPSANLLDGAAKQFDDGLYAAVDLACYRGELGFAPAAPEVIQGIFGKLPAGSPARPLLAAALELAGRKASLTPAEQSAKQSLLREFDADQTRSKPIGFYDWTPELMRVWQFYRFLQGNLDQRECDAVAAPLATDADLLKQYRAVNGFYGRLTNPLACRSVDSLIGKKWGPPVAIFPPSSSRETELFRELFPLGIPKGTNLMSHAGPPHSLRRSESQAERQGRLVSVPGLCPGDNDLAHARPGARQAPLDRHVQEAAGRGLPGPDHQAARDPRAATRNGRSDSAGANATAGRHPRRRPAAPHRALPDLLSPHRAGVRLPAKLPCGDRRQGPLEQTPRAAARAATASRAWPTSWRRSGSGSTAFTCVSCEDIGMKPQLLADEPVDREVSKTAALEWLKDLAQNADLACDTRVSLPIYRDDIARRTRSWATLGVRLARLDADYARPPKVRLKKSGGNWTEVPSDHLSSSQYVIPVDEFAEFELPGLATLSRAEFRALCDRCGTKEAILKAIGAVR